MPRKRRRREQQRAWWPWAAGAVALAAVAIALAAWPRPATYARYGDGARPTLIFVYSDPNPGHPHG